MQNGSIVEGSISARNETHLTMECLGGRVLLPVSKIEKIDEANPGESELVLGLQLLERDKNERAREFLMKASQYTQWKADAQNALQQVIEKKKENEQQQKAQEQQEIERIIATRGVQAGINELQRRHRTTSQDGYWGQYRGRMHLIMARERLDHLDVKGAERHLALAEQYGSTGDEWNEVRDEIEQARSGRVLMTPRTITIKPKRYTKMPQLVTPRSAFKDWLTAAEQARLRGERVPPSDWLKMVEQYAQENDLDPLLVWALIDTESSWRPTVVSSVGAQGLMQLMPGTADDMEVSDPFDPEDNIRGGTQYMRYLLTMFQDTDKALAAYNMGPGTIGRADDIPDAGKRYIKKIRTRYAYLQEKYGTRT